MTEKKNSGSTYFIIHNSQGLAWHRFDEQQLFLFILLCFSSHPSSPTHLLQSSQSQSTSQTPPPISSPPLGPPRPISSASRFYRISPDCQLMPVCLHFMQFVILIEFWFKFDSIVGRNCSSVMRFFFLFVWNNEMSDGFQDWRIGLWLFVRGIDWER